MYRILLLVSISCLAFQHSQGQDRILRAYAFYTNITPGNIPVDDNGKPRPIPLNITREIYVEYAGSKAPVVTDILYGNVHMISTLAGINTPLFQVGKRNDNGQDIVLTPNKGCRFWKIELQPVSGIDMPGPDIKHIVIKTKAGSKLNRFYLYKETALQARESY